MLELVLVYHTFWAISDNDKDLTFTPKIYANEK